MASKSLVQMKYKIPLCLAFIVLFTASGYFLALSKNIEAVVLFISGLVTLVCLIWLYDYTDRLVTFFINAMRNNDTSIQFPVNIKNKALAHLHEGMNLINRNFQLFKMKNEYNENYYKALIRHSHSGMLVLNKSNQVVLMNNSACKYAGISNESTNPNHLEMKNPVFHKAVIKLEPGKDVVFKHVNGNDYQVLAFRATLMRNNEEELKLVSIHDIRQEMESKELDSYRKLIRVLTHEIMNLVSPITSISKSMKSLYYRNGMAIALSDFNNEILNTTQKGLQLIDEQSQGLASFIENYRRISRIPQPVIRHFDASEWTEQLRIVYGEKMKEHRISFQITKESMAREIIADKNLLNQVMINLINNAMDAVLEIENDRKISVDISIFQQARIRIRISDNGTAIPPEIQEKIFVPFFTTKANGSGIGLSICQEIIKLHHGSLMVISIPGGMTSFVIEL